VRSVAEEQIVGDHLPHSEELKHQVVTVGGEFHLGVRDRTARRRTAHQEQLHHLPTPQSVGPAGRARWWGVTMKRCVDLDAKVIRFAHQPDHHNLFRPSRRAAPRSGNPQLVHGAPLGMPVADRQVVSYGPPMDEPPAPPDRSLPVLARDEQWIVVAKPPRLLVHRAPMAKADHYALQLLRDQLGQRVHPIHRLDRPASGCLLFALTRRAIPSLQQALASEEAIKSYLAFVRGEWRRERQVVVDNPMKDDRGRMRDALSVVACVGTSREPRCSLLRVWPRTGRFHQVRRHVRDLDHPVLGDAAHGDTRVNRQWREQYALPRLGLHCLSLDLPLPNGGRLRATCPVYEDLQRVWRAMPWWDEAVDAIPALALPPLPVPDYLCGNGAD